MKKYLAQFFLDTLAGAYIAVLVHHIVWAELILYQPIPFAWSGPTSSNLIPLLPDWLLYVIIGAGYALFAITTKASIVTLIRGELLSSTWQRRFAVHLSWLLLCLTFVTGWIVTKISLVDMFSQERISAAGRIFSSLMTPEFSILPAAINAIVETVYLAFMATVLAVPVAFILSFFSARNLMKSNVWTRIAYTMLRAVTNFTRSIEPLVWAVIFTVWVKVGPFPGMLALMVHTISSLVKQYSEQIEDIDPGPMEAIASTGARPLQIVWFGVVPQIFIPFLSFTIYRWDINVRMATVIGLVGGGGIGTMLNQYQMLAQWHEVGLIVLVIAVVVWVMDYVSARIREALV